MLSHRLRAVKKSSANIQYIGYSSGNNATTGSLTLSVPTGTQAGDLLVGFGYASGSGSLWTITGGGWTLTHAGSSNPPRLTGFYRVADATTSFTFAQNSVSADINIVLMAFRNASFDVNSTLSSASDPITIASVTASLNNSVQLITAGANSNYPASTPAGFTQVYLYSGPAQPQLGAYYKANISSGATGSISVDMTGATSSSGMQIIIKPN